MAQTPCLSRLDFVFKGLLNVREAQLVQETRDQVRVRIARRPGYSDQDAAAIISNLRERCGSTMRLSLEYVEEIPRTPSGKFRYVISKVPVELAGVEQTGEVLGVASEEEKTL